MLERAWLMEADLSTTKLVKTQANDSFLNDQEPLKETAVTVESFFLALFGFAIAGAVTISLFKKLSKTIEQREVVTKLSKIPCPNCHFFSKSTHLRCAVHPKTAMTKDAFDCSDYMQRDQ